MDDEDDRVEFEMLAVSGTMSCGRVVAVLSSSSLGKLYILTSSWAVAPIMRSSGRTALAMRFVVKVPPFIITLFGWQLLLLLLLLVFAAGVMGLLPSRRLVAGGDRIGCSFVDGCGVSDGAKDVSMRPAGLVGSSVSVRGVVTGAALWGWNRSAGSSEVMMGSMGSSGFKCMEVGGGDDGKVAADVAFSVAVGRGGV